MGAARCHPLLPLNGRFAAYSASHGSVHTFGYLVRLLSDLNVNTGNSLLLAKAMLEAGWSTRGAVGAYAVNGHRLREVEVDNWFNQEKDKKSVGQQLSNGASTSTGLRVCLEKRSCASYVKKAVADKAEDESLLGQVPSSAVIK